MITTPNFFTVSVTMIQKYISYKEECLSCDQSVIITDFETGEFFAVTMVLCYLNV